MRDETALSIQNINLSILGVCAEKLLDEKKINFNPEKFNFQKLSSIVNKYKNDPLVLEILEENRLSDNISPDTLKSVFSDSDTLKFFVTEFSKVLFITGKLDPAKIHEDTANLLRNISIKIDELKLSTKRKSPSTVLKELKVLDSLLLNYVVQNSDATNPNIKESTARISKANYWALNEQHKQISLVIKEIEGKLLQDTLDHEVFSLMENKGLLGISDLEDLSAEQKKSFRQMVDLGLVSASDIKGLGKVYAYAHGQIADQDFDKLIPKLLREELGRVLVDEFELKYSGKVQPIGISETRVSGVPSILDRVRVKKIAAKVGLEPAHVVLALKYLAKNRLIEANNGAYTLSPIGEAIGLGFKAIKLVKRAFSQKNTAITSYFRKYLELAVNQRKEWAAPTYTLKTETGGLPLIFVMDRFLIPNARFNGDIFEHSKEEINSKPGSLVILGNVLQGLAAIDKRQLRTSVKGFDDLDSQFAAVKDIHSELNAKTLHILGPNLDKSNERRAFEQAVREKGAGLGEDIVRTNLEFRNDQKQYAMQQMLAREINNWAEFLNRVVTPFELKLGREVWESSDIHERTSIDMNELEILRDISSILIESGSLENARSTIASNYNDFLKAVEGVEPNYLEKLSRVIFPNTEEISEDELVSRAGALIQLKTKDGVDGLKINIVADTNYGKALSNSPTTSMIGYTKSAANRGEADLLGDVNFVMNASEPWVSVTATGKWIMSSGTMEDLSAEPRDLYYDFPQDSFKKRRSTRGRLPETGVLSVEGGIDEGIVTHAYKFSFTTPKLLAVIKDNKRRNLKNVTEKIYCTSDQQTGSPTMKTDMFVIGLLYAIKQGVDKILGGGDWIQGMNYLRYAVEAQLVKNPLIGVEDQKQYMSEIFSLILEYIGRRYKADPINNKLPEWIILAGNHEINTQANKGLQGDWQLTFLEKIISSYYHGLTGDKQLSESLVKYPRKYITHDGISVDYPDYLVDQSQTTGWRISASHYDGVGGSKSSSFTPPISGAAKAAHSREEQEAHMIIRHHFHTPCYTTVNGIVCIMFGANAGQSGFERHLGYVDSQPSNGMIELSPYQVPSFHQWTEKYIHLKEKEVIDDMRSHGMFTDFDSIEEFLEHTRDRVSQRSRGITDYSKIPKGLPHDAVNPNRAIFN